jgi:hypothetical protein
MLASPSAAGGFDRSNAGNLREQPTTATMDCGAPNTGIDNDSAEFQVVRSRSTRRKQHNQQQQQQRDARGTTARAASAAKEEAEVGSNESMSLAPTESHEDDSPAAFRGFLKFHFPDLPFDEPCHILMFEDVWDWKDGLRYLKTAHSWTEMARERDRIATTMEKQPWFHAFHVETRRILNVRRRQVTMIDDPPESYLERLLENIDIPLEIKPKLL